MDLVQAQDAGVSVAVSRKRMAEKYSLSIEQVVAIEKEGMSRSWAPL